MTAFPRWLTTTTGELRGYPELAGAARLESAVWHVHAGDVPASGLPVSFRMLLNPAAVTGAESKERLWEFLRRSQPEYAPDTHPKLDAAAACAVRYFLEVLRPRRSWHHPDPREAEAIRALRDALAAHAGEATAEALQDIAYEVGKVQWGDLRGWFRLLYQTLLGHDQGPRFGAFVAIYGTDNTVALIDRALAGEFAGEVCRPGGLMNANLYTKFPFADSGGPPVPVLETAGGRVWNSTEIDRAAACYAQCLRGLGVHAGDRVASLVTKSPEALFLYLACLRAGAVHTPLSPD